MRHEIRFYTRLLLRRAPAMLILFLLCSAIGLILAMRLPTTYQSGARMLVQSQEISEDLAASTVQINALEEIEILRERLMTRANLIDIARDYDVYDDPTMTPDEIVEAMQDDTNIRADGGSGSRGGPRPALLFITFEARTGQIAADVVNEYVTRITSENVETRTSQAEETLEFFEQEVNRLSTELEIRSARITEFQRENADALPDDQEFRLQRQSLLQERMAAAERERRALLETRERTVQVFNNTGGAVVPDVNLSPAEVELQALQVELADLQTVFSDSSPQVQRVMRRIENLQNQIARQAPVQETEAPASNEERLLAIQLADIDSRIDALDTLILDTQGELDRLDEAITQAPVNGITLQGLQREFESTQLEYDNASRSLAQASIGLQLELGGQGQRVILLDPAVVPSAPASPNRPMIAAAGVAGGLGLAAAFFMLLELMNRAVRRPAEITKSLNIAPLVTIPYLETSSRRFFRRATRIAITLAVVIGVPAALWAVDQYVQPLDVVASQILDRLGLT